MFRTSLVCCLAWLMAVQPLRAEMPDSTVRSSAAEFADGGLHGFRRWVFDRLTFSPDAYAEGELVAVQVSFTVTRQGKLRSAELVRTSHKAAARHVLRLLGQSPDWTPRLFEGKPADTEMRVNFEMRLCNVAAAGADPVLRAEDVSIYTEADSLPRFRDGGNGFSEWLRERVLSSVPSLEKKEWRKVRFVIEKDGSVSDIRVSGLKDDPLRVALEAAMKELPPVIPAVLQGEKVHFRAVAEPWFGPEDGPYLLADRMPRFRGGDLNDFRRWVHRSVRYPTTLARERIQGRVIVSFVVERDGSVSHVEIVQSPHRLFSEEVLRALADTPRWTPGMHDGKPVRIKHTIPVDFRIPSPPVTPTGQRTSRRF